MKHRSVVILALAAAALAVIAYARFGNRRGATSAANIAGVVRDERGSPLAGAVVRIQGRAEFVVSDRSGRFDLPTADAAAGAVITASRQGYLIGSARLGREPLTQPAPPGGESRVRGPLEISLTPLPTDDAADYAWVEPAANAGGEHNCANCHEEMFREWSASSHGRSATGRHFRNLYDGTDARGRPNVGWGLLTQYPEGSGVCTSCHAPSVRPGDPASFDLRQVQGTAARGVHCDYCHKIVGTTISGNPQSAIGNPQSLGLTHGRDALKLLRPAAGQLFFGPLDDVDRGEDAYVPLYRESRYCAACHEGTLFGVPVYTTYSEWLASPARREGKECQSCHMAATGTMTNFATGKGGIERAPGSLAGHRFPGGTPAMLRRCLKLSAKLMPDADNVHAAIEVSAEQVGHRVPTGFIDRHLVLVVEPLDGAGKRLAAKSGPVLPPAAGRECAGQPGRLYAKLLLAEDGVSPAPFWKRETEPVDTRLVPGKVDRLDFMLPKETRSVRVRLLYRRFWPAVAVEKGWDDNEVVVAMELWRVIDE